MNAGVEYLFWMLLFALIIICWVISEIVEHFKPEEPLPKPAMQCVDRGPVESWEVGKARVRFP
jgi:Na+-transporting methylmalonyl-CoA/oxaloacetate decarboxylase gamma subunit